MKKSNCSEDRRKSVLSLQTSPIEKTKGRHWALAYSGWTTAIDRVLSDAVREHDVRELLNYMDEFVTRIRSAHVPYRPEYKVPNARSVQVREQSGKHLLAMSISHLTAKWT